MRNIKLKRKKKYRKKNKYNLKSNSSSQLKYRFALPWRDKIKNANKFEIIRVKMPDAGTSACGAKFK